MARTFAVAVALGTIVWWTLIFASADVRVLFTWKSTHPFTLHCFLVPDALFFVYAPLRFAIRYDRWAYEAFTWGAAYATVFTVALCLTFGGGELGGILMLLAAAGALYFRREVGVDESPESAD